MGSLMFLDRIDANAARTPQGVADWIARNVPCPVNRVDATTTDAVITTLRKAFVRDDVIAKGMAIAEMNGHPFSQTTLTTQLSMLAPGVLMPMKLPSDDKHDRMGPAPTIEPFQAEERAKYLEALFINAQRAGDTARMQAIASEFAGLLWMVLKGIAKGRAEQDKTREAGEKLLQLAPNIGRVLNPPGIRRPADPRIPMPTPGNGNVRIIMPPRPPVRGR